MAVALVTKPLLIRGTPVLVPASARDVGILERRRQNVPLNTLLRGPHRSRPQENLYRKLLRVVGDGIGEEPENLHKRLKGDAGKWVLKSCADMDDAEFSAYVAASIERIFAEIIPGADRAGLFEEVEKLVDPGW